MKLYGQYHNSLPQKTLITIIEILLLRISFWILFQNGGDWLAHTFSIHNATEQTGRRMVIFIFNIVTFGRLGYMMFVLLKRKIPWQESISIPFAFALYYVGFSLLVLPTAKALDFLDFGAVILFIVGSILNTGGEIMRDKWKKKPENKGRLYTGGFFRYARHINYFGDLLWVIGYAIISGNYYAVIIPVILFCFFAFYNAPLLDQYLKNKYGKAYERYANKTKMLIPFLY
ncbi:methyltransferase family protein [Arachidicoccus terrestris]|uniref:methyltransferase family protein n=1 Tax=Arachidicoccus terrestris TaxID=2875539 RepID=UPI001CC3DE19|nr:DUF1295 domain-containing protein [Arachidicoccus terrestris]UAY55202.1 DUF1295 domain-containing protein [Arachidicoccus terrestris]